MALALFLGLLTAGANVVGSYLGVARRSTNVPATGLLIGLSGGFVLGVAVLEILPEALDGGGPFVPPVIVAGYLLMYLIEQYFAAHAHAPSPTATS